MHITGIHCPQTPLPSRLPYSIEKGSLCYTVSPCWLSILNKAVCTCPSLTIPPPILLSTTINLCSKSVSLYFINNSIYIISFQILQIRDGQIDFCSSSTQFYGYACSVMADSLRPHGLEFTRLLYPWNFPGKNTGKGSHSLLQGICLTQGSNLSLLHYSQILCHCATWEAPAVWL